MKAATKKQLILINSMICLTLLSGCDWFSKKSNDTDVIGCTVDQDSSTMAQNEQTGQEVLLRIDGKPVITVADFQGHLEQIVESNPQVSSLIESIPAMKENIFSGMVSQELLKLWIEKNKITQTEQYQKDLDMMKKLVEYELARKYFQEDVQKSVVVTASDVKAFYDRHKASMPDIVLNPGGVKAVGVAFNNKEQADKFITAMGDKANFKKEAEKERLKVVDFGVVNDYQVDLDKTLKQAFAQVEKVPSVLSIKENDTKYWVCLATEKEAPEYRPLAEVQAGIEQVLKNEKLNLMFGQKIEALKVVYRAEENKQYFEKNALAEMLEQAQYAQAETQTEPTTSRVA